MAPDERQKVLRTAACVVALIGLPLAAYALFSAIMWRDCHFIQDDRICRHWVDYTSEDSDDLREEKLEVLRRDGLPAIRLLIRYLKGKGPLAWLVGSRKRIWTQAEAAYTLGEVGNKAAVPALIGALEDDSPWVKYAAASALGDIGDKAAVPALIRVLEKEEKGDGQFLVLVDALAKFRDVRTVPVLIDFLLRHQDDDYFVSGTAYALEIITGERPYDMRPEKNEATVTMWVDWWEENKNEWKVRGD